MLRTSEFWIAIATAAGTVVSQLGWVSKEDWSNIFWPAVVYVISRITSKAVKAV